MIVEANTDRDFACARELFEEYGQSLGFSLCFQDFSFELDHLREMYGPPYGSLLLALEDGAPIACVGLRKQSETACEMKRLYVRPSARGQGLGRRLSVELIGRARFLGYQAMLLDTLHTMQAAQALYRSLGFRETPPYYANPIPGAVYLELDLAVRQ